MIRPLRVAVASGKGGTGKTTIATSLAVAMARVGESVAYVDCDVEEPNGHLFMRPSIDSSREVCVLVPEVDEDRCTLCGACGSACRFSAIVALPRKVVTYPKLCHACGACVLACPKGAIHEVPRAVGVVEQGMAGEVAFVHGKLQVGEAMAPPVIRAVLGSVPGNRTLVFDAPPGTSCPVIAAVETADVVLLVTEPTPFGLNDLMLAVAMLRDLGTPFGVAVNRVGSGDDAVWRYCEREGIPLLLEIPDDREIARAYSRGELLVMARPDLAPRLLGVFARLGDLAQERGARPRKPRPVVFREAPAAMRPPSENLQLGRRRDVAELVVVSGKGGTGKTSVVASFFALAAEATVGDCDVDAADLHLVLGPRVTRSSPFSGGCEATIDEARCSACGRCAELCRFGAIEPSDGGTFAVDPIACEGCGLCADVCPSAAATLAPSLNGEWFVSETRHGPMVHARLGVAQENSGKLVSLVRREAKAVSLSSQRSLLIVDGSPGIGCPVIASLAGARFVLIVTEPTISGLHDLGRVADLCRQFAVTTGVCINKCDINLEVSDAIEAEAARRRLLVMGRIRYDECVTAAQVGATSVVELGDGPAASDIRMVWDRVRHAMAWEAEGVSAGFAPRARPETGGAADPGQMTIGADVGSGCGT